MKKLLGILVLGLLWCNVDTSIATAETYGSCYKKIDYEWNTHERTDYATFKITSRCEYPIYVKYVSVSTSDRKEIKRKNLNNKYLRAYGAATYHLYLGDINQNIVKFGGPRWSTKPPEKKTTDAQKNIDKLFEKDESWFRWWYIPLGIVALVILGAIGDAISGSKESIKSSDKKIDKENPPTISEQALFNFIARVWSGRETLSLTFWLCFIVINGIISAGSGYLAESNDNNIFLLAAIAANIWAGVGVWNSSTNYQAAKLKLKQSYGWAYAAKIAIVLNFLLLTSQVVVFLGIA